MPLFSSTGLDALNWPSGVRRRSKLAAADRRIAFWGDSLAGPTQFQTDILNTFRRGYTGYQGSVGGQTSTQVKDRFIVVDPSIYNYTTIFCCGSISANAATTVSDLNTMIGLLTHSRFLILSAFNSSAQPVGSGAGYTNAINTNVAVAASWPNNHLDDRAAMIAANLPADSADTSNDIVGASYRQDSIHFNATGAYLRASFIAAWLDAKGW